MKTIKNLTFLSFMMSLLIFTSCETEDKCAGVTCPNGQVCVEGTCEGSSANIIIDSDITTDTEWTADNMYELAGKIVVKSGATLTIAPGTVIKGQVGSTINATALIVERGGMIMADGTADLPIIFTTAADEITNEQVANGDMASPNLLPSENGLWGGLIILGNAPVSASVAEPQIEGLPTTETYGKYGGTVADDNSGVLRYVSIRHGGANIGVGNEINGLTLGGVGSGTTIENIEIIGNQDDGVEFFGGTVNVSNLVILNVGDDAVDTDQEWAGTLNNFVVIAGSATDHALELDGGEGTITNVKFTLQNGSCLGYFNDEDSLGGEYADLRSNLQCILNGIYFTGFGKSADFELDNAGISDNYTNGDISITGMKFNVSHLVTGGNTTVAQIMQDKSGQDAFASITSTQAEIVSAKTGGANTAVFANWTWTEQANLLDGL
jgi:hypothetical protein